MTADPSSSQDFQGHHGVNLHFRRLNGRIEFGMNDSNHDSLVFRPHYFSTAQNQATRIDRYPFDTYSVNRCPTQTLSSGVQQNGTKVHS